MLREKIEIERAITFDCGLYLDARTEPLAQGVYGGGSDIAKHLTRRYGEHAKGLFRGHAGHARQRLDRMRNTCGVLDMNGQFEGIRVLGGRHVVWRMRRVEPELGAMTQQFR
jgi:hypothetical protein